MEEKEIENNENECFFCYYELHTEYGPLYIYEKYKKDPDTRDIYECEMPITKEFFTEEEGIRGLDTIDFLNRTAKFKTSIMSMHGFYKIEDYKERLAPYEFLMRVAPFLETEEAKKEKIREVYNIFEDKANNIGNTRIIKSPQKKYINTENEYAIRILKKYIK